MIFKKILNCFFPSFNSKIETSKIESWVICEHTTHKHTHQQAQPNTQTHPPKTKTLITHKHTTHKHTTHKHCCGCTTGPKKKKKIVISVGV